VNRAAILAECFLLLGTLRLAFGTTIVVKLERNRIIMAADTREDRLTPTSGQHDHAFHDNGCKIVALGPTAVGISGNLDYKRNSPSDTLSDWSALSDADAAFREHAGDIFGMAKDWAQRSARHYALFNETAPQRVQQLASVNSEHVLVDAFFVGWVGQVPILIWEKVYLDGNAFSAVISVKEQILPPRELPYTTNAITQELIEGGSSRTESAMTEWKAISSTMSKQEADWRQIGYFVKATGKYDESVGPTANILEIPAGGEATWLQNVTCRP